MFGERIKERRKLAGLTQTQLGEAVGVRKNTVSDWERCKYKPDIETVAEVARVLNTRAAYLLEYDDDPEDYETLLETADVPLDVIRHFDGDAEAAYKAQLAMERDALNEMRQHHSDTEDAYIKKYRALDEHGKRAVEAIIDVEFARVSLRRREEVRSVYFPISEQSAAAGYGTYLGPDALQPVKVRENALPKGAQFGVPVKGNSMEPKYRDGDILIVSKKQPSIGDIGIFIVEGQGYVKQLGEGELISLNPAYRPIKIDESTRACGKVIGVLDKDAIVQ